MSPRDNRRLALPPLDDGDDWRIVLAGGMAILTLMAVAMWVVGL